MSRRSRRHRRQAVGLSPGTLVHVGEQKTDQIRGELTRYGPDRLETGPVVLDQLRQRPHANGDKLWLNIEGLHDVAAVGRIGEAFGIHPLTMEDILNTFHRPKADVFGDYLFVVLKMLEFDEASQELQAEQVSLVMGRGFVVSFQEGRQGDSFNPVRNRLKDPGGRLRRLGSDYLAYALMDVIVDHYFVILERLGDQMEELEDRLVNAPTTETLHTIHRLKRDILMVRRAVWPLREMALALERHETPLIQAENAIYYRDLYDHVIQIIDTVETYREMLAGMLDIYLSSLSNRMNSVMKVLTTIATLFMPLSFIAGFYGMNFQHMPELAQPWAYPAVIGVMLLVAGGMLLFFKRKKWL
ncbi:MAG TPA: magnesium/cobalt transporter CorA [Acidobacteriota bacterium]|jgi:magnesium transporter|nr:magnesium/cobalt transporter CorA [Acidobacteriota bacterium]HNT99118.1 magnesium/cobalt transporter CorA [Acidobacteriota bacterium]